MGCEEHTPTFSFLFTVTVNSCETLAKVVYFNVWVEVSGCPAPIVYNTSVLIFDQHLTVVGVPLLQSKCLPSIRPHS